MTRQRSIMLALALALAAEAGCGHGAQRGTGHGAQRGTGLPMRTAGAPPPVAGRGGPGIVAGAQDPRGPRDPRGATSTRSHDAQTPPQDVRGPPDLGTTPR
jgi:hypothetical protein